MDEHGNITYLVQSEIIPDAEITISETEDGIETSERYRTALANLAEAKLSQPCRAGLP